MKNNNDEEIIFGISKETLQWAAFERIGRRLSDDEISTARKCIEWGLLTDIDTIFTAAISASITMK